MSKKLLSSISFGPFKTRLPDEDDLYDVIVVGAGPTGSTCAYYLSQFGSGLFAGQGLRILLVEKAKFPRDKYCGDAWCAPALDILEDMNVLQELEEENLISNTLCGGFVSPAGHSFIANDKNADANNRNMATRCYAIKRIICDERIAKCAAKQPGVTLVENSLVTETIFDEKVGTWTVMVDEKSEIESVCKKYTSRYLVAADGSASNVARRLGIVKSPPEAFACRRYVKPGTHNFKGDGVLLYPDYTLPGYVALFRHFDDSVDVGAYFLPQTGLSSDQVSAIYNNKMTKDPFVMSALGPKVEFTERLKVASLRLGGHEKSYGDHIILVGDACGQVDPLTGEGIHTGMIGGKIAAECICEMFRKGNFSSKSSSVYHSLWMKEFGSDFPMSEMAGTVVKKLPFLMDAVPIASMSKGGKAGSEFFADFGAVMTGAKPKTTFLLPSVAFPLAVSTLQQLFGQYVLKSERKYYDGIMPVTSSNVQSTWRDQCLIDKNVLSGNWHKETVLNEASDVFKFERDLRHDFGDGFTDKDKTHILVLYGTEYGYSKEVAELFCKTIIDQLNTSAASQIFIPRCLNMKHFQVINWDLEQICLSVCSTAGDGDPPADAIPFFDFLKDCQLKNSGILNTVNYSVLALGDSGYPKYCEAGNMLHSLFKDLGAKCFLDNNSNVHCVDCEDTLVVNAYLAGIMQKLKHYPANKNDDYLQKSVEENISLFDCKLRATRAKPFNARIRSKFEITNRIDKNNLDEKETWKILIDVSDDDDNLLEYSPGDALGVLPKNKPAIVRDILKALQLKGDEPCSHQSHTEELTIFDCLTSHCDLRKPSHLFLSEIERITPMLKLFADADVLDILKALPPQLTSTATERKTLLAKLGKLEPRFYSIVSSPLDSPGIIELCVAAVRYNSPSSNKDKYKEGVCSSYLIDSCKTGSIVKVFIQVNSKFRLPIVYSGSNEEQEVKILPKIMFGPGTGIAPFISFIRHENVLLRPKSASSKETIFGKFLSFSKINTEDVTNLQLKDEKVAQSMLFFGCRNDTDFLYKDELTKYGQSEKNTLIVAFSRKQETKEYVQHKALEDDIRPALINLLKDEAQIFICGDGFSMAEGVKKALYSLVQKEFNLKEEDAVLFVNSRLHVDVWVS